MDPLRTQPPAETTRSKGGMVTSPHRIATQCGVDMLEAGGNAVEAAIATVAALCVTYPHFCGLGGDAFFIIADASGSVQTVSGIGQAAEAVGGYSGAIPVRGPRSALTTAATVDAMGQAFTIGRDQLKGSQSWTTLLAPAIALAHNGYPVSASERFWLHFRQAEAADMPGLFAAMCPDGRVPEQGWVRHQPQLGHTLERLAANGWRDLYEGEVASALAAGLAQAGSPLTRSDLAATRARLQVPLRMPYRGGTLVAHQPPTQGVTTLQIMGILERFDLSKVIEGSADYYHLLVEAVKLAFMDRNHWVADPEFTDVPAERLLSAGHLDRCAARLDRERALSWPHTFQTGDTVYVGVADRMGNAVSMLATVYFDWGSGVMVGDTGVLWHNRGAAFSLDPAHPNCLAAGKRPFHTLNPGMYLKDGLPRILYGTQGADGQPQTLAAVLTRLIDYGMDPMLALRSPRFLLGKTFSDTRDSLKLEGDVPAEVVRELERRGHEVALLESQSPLMGHPGAVCMDANSGVFSGAHDPRSDGIALGVQAV